MSAKLQLAEPKIRVEALHKSFHGKVVLDRVDFSVKAGESLVVLGPSGTGKSVLLKHLIGLIQPDSGRVFVDGRDLWAVSDRERTVVRKKFGMSFQEGALFDSMSVFDNVAFPLRRSGRPAHQPEILLFDEPNTGLDPIMTDVIDEVILELKERLDVTVVTITHHIPSARKIGDRVALLYGGKIAYEATPEEFLKSEDPAVRQFVEGRADGPLTVEFEREGRTAVPEGP